MNKKNLAFFGGPKAIESEDESLFHWPIVTDEDINAVADVLRAGTMSGTTITKQFERAFGDWVGSKYALGCCNGTASLTAALFACGVGAGDEVICPSLTYWASCASALWFGATVNFADVEPDSLCLAPDDFERKIGPKTKAVIVVHYCGYPADMDRINAIAQKHGVLVIEDVSHAVGAKYKGRFCGTLGDIAGLSMMTGKAFAIGEAGMLLTDNRAMYERAILFGHYERTGAPSRYNPVDKQITMPDLLPYIGIALGGVKHRMNQTCAAMGLVQLAHYPDRMAEIDRAMNRFMDKLETIDGLVAHRPANDTGSTKGGWYLPCCHYDKMKFGGTSAQDFCDYVRAEGMRCVNGVNEPLHLHPMFHSADLIHQGEPTSLAFGQRDVRQIEGACPVTEAVSDTVIQVPWFKHDNAEAIEQYFQAIQKVAAACKDN